MTFRRTTTRRKNLKLSLAIARGGAITTLLDAKKFTVKAANEEEIDGKKADVSLVTPEAKKEVKILCVRSRQAASRSRHAHKGKAADESADRSVRKRQLPFGFQEDQRHPGRHKDGRDARRQEVHEYRKPATIEIMEKIDDKEFTIDD